MKKLHNLQIVSELVVTKLLRTIALLMRNFIANFVRILGICKDFAGNRVNELGDVQEMCRRRAVLFVAFVARQKFAQQRSNKFSIHTHFCRGKIFIC